jgi:hypothetical protein
MHVKSVISRLHGEEGQVWSYLLKIIVVFVVIGAIITQFGPIIWNHISVHGTADDAIDEAVTTYQQSRGNMEKVNENVQALLDSRDVRLEGSISLSKGQGGEPDTISLRVRNIVNTFLFEKVSYLCSYTEAFAYSERTVP